MSKPKSEKEGLTAIKKQLVKKTLTQKEKETHRLIAIDEFLNVESSDSKLSFSSSINLKVTKKFFDQYMRDKLPTPYYKGNSNAYVYGKLYKKDMIYIGSHSNDVANTGAYDVTDGVKFNSDNIYKYCEIAFKKPKIWNWFDRDFLKVIKTFYPEILFLGETVGGDVGADVYVHLDSDGEINSIMIDNEYFNKPSKD